MKLPIPHIPFGKKQPKIEYFLCLLLRDEQIAAYILEETNTQLQLVSKQEETLATQIEQETPEQWLDILDRVISKAEERLPKNVMTHKTMFGIKENWVEDKKIKKDYLAKLKHVCDSLDLEPIGFLVITEAICHQLQLQEGAPLTALLVEVGKQQVAVSHVRTGTIMETHRTDIVQSVAQTVDALLKHFVSATVLPSRIVIFDGMHTDQIAQEFISHQWSKTLPFLHMPQITALQHGFDAVAVIQGAAEQMGLTAHIPSLPDQNFSAESTTEPLRATRQTLAQQFMHAEQKEEKNEEHTSHQEQMPDAQPEQEHTHTIVTPPDNFGFVEEQDIAETSREHVQTQHSEKPDEEVQDATSFTQKKTVSPRKTMPGISVFQSFIQPIQNRLRGFMPSHTGLSIHGQPIPRWMYITPILLLAICAGIAWYILNVHASVTLTLNSKVTEQQGTITFSTAKSNDFPHAIISAQDISVTLQGSANTNATGQKQVGTPAKGTVTLYNNSSSPVSLSSGTQLTSSNNVLFTLDSDVTVASASGDVFSGTKPGTTDTTITAKNIGTSSNLPSGTTFSISGQSDVAAKNNSALSGGTQKQVTVVSQADLDSLGNKVIAGILDKAKTQLETKMNSDQAFIPGSTSTILSNKAYSAKLNDQVSSVSLTAAVTVHELAYAKQDLQQLDITLLKDKYTDNESLSVNSITSSLTNEHTVDPQTVSADIDVKADLLPKLNIPQLLSQITGKSVNEANALLKTEPQIQSSSITLQPAIPLIPQILPRFSQHIAIHVVTSQ